MKMLMFIDRIFALNMYGVATSYAASKMGLVNLEIINIPAREIFYQTAIEVSAYSAAVYGIYRVGKLIYDGISLIRKKIKNNKKIKT